jgi:Cation transport ATPase
VAAALEALSEHPVARAILDAARARGIAVEPAESFSAVPGKGAVGQIGGRTYLVGSPRLFAERGISCKVARRRWPPGRNRGKRPSWWAQKSGCWDSSPWPTCRGRRALR